MGYNAEEDPIVDWVTGMNYDVRISESGKMIC